MRILMIDDNIKLVDMIEEYFSNNRNITMSLKAYSGEEGINPFIFMTVVFLS